MKTRNEEVEKKRQERERERERCGEEREVRGSGIGRSGKKLTPYLLTPRVWAAASLPHTSPASRASCLETPATKRIFQGAFFVPPGICKGEKKVLIIVVCANPPTFREQISKMRIK